MDCKKFNQIKYDFEKKKLNNVGKIIRIKNSKMYTINNITYIVRCQNPKCEDGEN